MLTPDTKIYLIKCPGLIPGHSVKANVTLQNFLDRPDTITLTDYKIVSDNSFRTDIPYETLKNYNYLIYYNNMEQNRYWYCYITKVDCIQIRLCTVEFEVDILTTFRGQIALPPPYVLRMHTREGYGVNYQPEPEICPLEYNYEYVDGVGYNVKKIALLATATPSRDGAPQIREYNINGQPFLGYFVSDLDVGSNVLEAYHEEGTEGRIIKIVQYPIDTYSANGIANTVSQDYEKLDTIEGYTPVNKKCLQYPFQSIIMSNNRGTQTEYNFRYFINDIARFRYFWDGIIQNIGYAQPDEYVWSDDTISFVSTIPSIDLPFSHELSQTQYLTQAIERIGINAIANLPGNLTGSVLALETENRYGMMYGFDAINKPLADLAQTAIQAHNNVKFGIPPNGNITKNQLVNLMVERFSIYRKYALSSIIKSYDSFFERYGYAVNKTQSVNINGGGRYSYFQFNGNAQINASTDFNVKLNNLFAKGVTMWSSLSNIGVYDL